MKEDVICFYCFEWTDPEDPCCGQIKLINDEPITEMRDENEN